MLFWNERIANTLNKMPRQAVCRLLVVVQQLPYRFETATKLLVALNVILDFARFCLFGHDFHVIDGLVRHNRQAIPVIVQKPGTSCIMSVLDTMFA